MNNPPPAPPLVAPANGTSGWASQVSLRWASVIDPDGDPVTYRWWVSEFATFNPSTQGTTSATNAMPTLALGKQYYWKIEASDGYEYAGNQTVWWFRTASAVVPVHGEIRGGVTNGSAPIPGATIELLVNDYVVAATLTPANGTFRLLDLSLRTYVVRITAPGFQTTTLSAEPTQTSPVVDLGDVALTRSGAGGGTPNPFGIPGWLVLLLEAALVVVLVIALVVIAVGSRRARHEPGVTEAGVQPESKAPFAEEAFYECPVCGREVAAEARRCECGAEFEE